MPLILKTSGVQLSDEVIEITQFCNKFLAEISARAKKSNALRIKTVNKLMSVLHTKNLSIFDFFVMIDTSRCGAVT